MVSNGERDRAGSALFPGTARPRLAPIEIAKKHTLAERACKTGRQHGSLFKSFGALKVFREDRPKRRSLAREYSFNCDALGIARQCRRMAREWFRCYTERLA